MSRHNTIWITGDAYIDEAAFLDAATRARAVLASDPEVGHVARRMRTTTVHTPSTTTEIPEGASGPTPFGAYIHRTGNLRLHLGRVYAWRHAQGLGYYDELLVLVNSSVLGGHHEGSMRTTYVAANSPHFGEILKHEFLGHGLAGLGDEYITTQSVYTGGEFAAPNLDIVSDPSRVKWAHMIGRDDGMGGKVGVFEGGAQFARGVYRPTPTSKMRQLYKPWGPVNAEAIIVAAGRFIPPLEGDLNGDGRVDFDDLNLALAGGDFAQANDVLSNFGRSE